ncbi:MAG: glycosyltransferase, partial [Deltaproteobacteria bacterium]|nr:glycosyltransferase [Deltaproteobacteria bacterium]
SFLGYGYPNRVQTFVRLTNYNFKIWGRMWPKNKPFDKMVVDTLLPPEEYVKIFNASKININLHSSSEKDFIEPFGDFVNPRTFELAACRAFQLTDKRALLAELFGDAIVTFESFSELKDLIDYYLKNDFERKVKAEQAYKIATSRHTYLHRAIDMMRKILSKDSDKLFSNISACKWNQVIRQCADLPDAKRMFEQAFLNSVPWDFDSICSHVLLGKKEGYREEELKLLFLYHCNRNSRKFIKYA